MKILKTMLWGSGIALALGGTALAAQGFGPMWSQQGGCGMGGRMMGGGMMGRGMMGGGFRGWARFLNLTDAQKAKARAIEESHWKSLQTKTDAAEDTRDAMQKALADPAASDAQIKELHTKMADAMTAVMLERRSMQREFEAILTADQKAIIEKQRTQRGPGPGMMSPGGF